MHISKFGLFPFKNHPVLQSTSQPTKVDRKCTYKRSIQGRWSNHCSHGQKNKYYIYWVCVDNVSYPTCKVQVPYCNLWLVGFYYIFANYLIKAMNLEKKRWQTIFFFLFFNFVRNISHSKTNSVRYYHKCNVSLILVRFQWHLNFLNTFSITTPTQNFMKIRPVGAELFIADGRTWS